MLQSTVLIKYTGLEKETPNPLLQLRGLHKVTPRKISRNDTKVRLAKGKLFEYDTHTERGKISAAVCSIY